MRRVVVGAEHMFDSDARIGDVDGCHSNGLGSFVWQLTLDGDLHSL